MSETKMVAIRGDAVAAYTKERKTRKAKRSGLEESQKGGFDVPSGEPMQLRQSNLNAVSSMVKRMSGGATAAPTLAPAPTPAPTPLPTPAPLPTPTPLPKLQGGAKPKLILEPKKRSMKKLHLAPATIKSSSGMGQTGHTGHTSHTGKRSVAKTRKIRVSLSGMKKRLTRAKEIHKESRNSDIADIKKKLIEAKLIKPSALTREGTDTTEYDMLLRKTYEDYMLLRGRAL